MKAIIAAAVALMLAGCAPPQQPAYMSPQEQADFAQCSYESVAATASSPGILIPALQQVQMRNMCLRARAAQRQADAQKAAGQSGN